MTGFNLTGSWCSASFRGAKRVVTAGLLDLLTPRLRENGTRLGFPPAAEVTLVRGVLLDIGGIALFRCVGMMFVLRQLLVFRHFRSPLRTFLTAIGRWHRWHMARHDSTS